MIPPTKAALIGLLSLFPMAYVVGGSVLAAEAIWDKKLVTSNTLVRAHLEVFFAVTTFIALVVAILMAIGYLVSGIAGVVL